MQMIGRLLTCLGVWISLLFALNIHPVFAHSASPTATMTTQQATDLHTDATLCGEGGYRIGDTEFCTHGADAPVQVNEFRSAQALLASKSTSSIVCIGDGISGQRVQILYVRTVGQADHYQEVVAQLRTIAAEMDGIYDASAQETGGHRHIRFVTNADCEVDVVAVELPANANDSFAATVQAMRTLGYSNSQRKYILFTESEVYCGISTSRQDSQPGQENVNNKNGGYSRVDRSCWNAVLSVHELTHALGGVQLDAPHSTGYGHCTDTEDIMCYKDSENAPALLHLCDERYSTLLDCNHDDYFSTNPAADNYLATHWNVANSAFLLNPPADYPATDSLTVATDDNVTDVPPATPVNITISDLGAAHTTSNYIKSVTFFLDGVKLTTVTTAPYRWVWPGADLPGVYTLTAQIETNDDIRITSQPLHITVKPATVVSQAIYLPVIIVQP